MFSRCTIVLGDCNFTIDVYFINSKLTQNVGKIILSLIFFKDSFLYNKIFLKLKIIEKICKIFSIQSL